MTGLTPGQAASRIGSSFSNNGSAPTGATTILSPASNINGAYVRACAFSPASGFVLQLVGGTAAPTSGQSNPVALVAPNSQAQLQRDIFFPPGQGIFVFNTDTGAGGTWNMMYDLC